MIKTDQESMIPEHVFISFSQKDKEIAEFIVYKLWRNDIPVWIDYARLAPGTPDWETAIRDAIEKSFAVIVLASPESRESRFVRGELNVAESKGRRIYPVWINGTDWSECIPLGMTYAQYIDARDEQRQQGVANLCAVLKQHIHNAMPKHYYVSPLRRIIGQKPNEHLTQVSPPPGFVSVEVTEGGGVKWQEGGSAAFFRLSDYSCMQAFLDDLYLNYVKERFKPFTYGSSWLLENFSVGGYRIILAPWSWLVGSRTSIDFESDWLLHTPISECGFRSATTSWSISEVTDVKLTGLAINDERILRAMLENSKAEYLLRRDGILVDMPIDQVVVSGYKFRYVISYMRISSEERKPGSIIVQTQKELPEELINFWVRK
jgi:hypothetical protein